MNWTMFFRGCLLGSALIMAANAGHAFQAKDEAKPQAFLDRGSVTLITTTDKATAVLRVNLIEGTAELMATTPMLQKVSFAPVSSTSAKRLSALPFTILTPGGSGHTEAVCTAETGALMLATQNMSQNCDDPESQACVTAQMFWQQALSDFTACMSRHFTQER